MNPLLEVSGLSVAFPGAGVQAVRDVSWEVHPGETIGLVGESGSGKSATGLAVLGLHGPGARITGSIRLDGRELVGAGERELRRIRGRRVSMIFQDALDALNPYRPVGAQIAEAYRLHHDASRAAARTRAVELLERVGIDRAERRAKDYPHQFSGGMRQRVMIAAALVNEPDLVIADEPTTALDATVQAQVLRLLTELQREMGMAVVLVTHDFGVVGQMCSRVVVMYRGRVVEQGPTDRILTAAHHPYARALVASVPRMDDPPGSRLPTVPETVASLIGPIDEESLADPALRIPQARQVAPPADGPAPAPAGGAPSPAADTEVSAAAAELSVADASSAADVAPSAAPVAPGVAAIEGPADAAGASSGDAAVDAAVGPVAGASSSVDGVLPSAPVAPGTAAIEGLAAVAGASSGGSAVDAAPGPVADPSSSADGAVAPARVAAVAVGGPGDAAGASSKGSAADAAPMSAGGETTPAGDAEPSTSADGAPSSAPVTDVVAVAAGGPGDVAGARPGRAVAAAAEPPAAGASSSADGAPSAEDVTAGAITASPAAPAASGGRAGEARSGGAEGAAESDGGSRGGAPGSGEGRGGENTPTPLLRVRDLTVTFPGGLGRTPHRAVDGVSFDIAPGESFGLVGESGSGKSTISRVLLGLRRPDDGSVVFDGEDITRPARRRGRAPAVQMVFQDPYGSLNPDRRIGHTIGAPLALHTDLSRAGRRERVASLLSEVGLEPALADAYPDELSGGMRQRVGIARALALEPRLLVADEPVSALDVSVQAQVLNLLTELRRSRGLAMLFVSHDLTVVRHMCSRIAVLHRGRIVEVGERDQIMERPGSDHTRALLDAMPAPAHRAS
ncbi:dipeptide ABC transporter ATP-binding protein [Streptomyces sp. NPDC021354]|uniref:dipeptide ABC transporter ATP-binding protein n=1 Tax=Streptomyces sp. NPDC021354 TaxID=3154793 RepID=UPI0033CCABAA